MSFSQKLMSDNSVKKFLVTKTHTQIMNLKFCYRKMKMMNAKMKLKMHDMQ